MTATRTIGTITVGDVKRLTAESREQIAESVASFKEMFEMNGDTVKSVSEPFKPGTKFGYVVHMDCVTPCGWDMAGPVILIAWSCTCGGYGLMLGEGLASCKCGACEG